MTKNTLLKELGANVKQILELLKKKRMQSIMLDLQLEFDMKSLTIQSVLG